MLLSIMSVLINIGSTDYKTWKYYPLLKEEEEEKKKRTIIQRKLTTAHRRFKGMEWEYYAKTVDYFRACFVHLVLKSSDIPKILHQSIFIVWAKPDRTRKFHQTIWSGNKAIKQETARSDYISIIVKQNELQVTLTN